MHYEPSTGYYYDWNTGFYFDEQSGYYYDDKADTWQFWCTRYRTYLPANSPDPRVQDLKREEEERMRNPVVANREEASAAPEVRDALKSSIMRCIHPH